MQYGLVWTPVRNCCHQTLILIALAYSLISGEVFAASPSNTPNSNLWITDGRVQAIAQYGDTIFAGGAFSYVGPYTGGAACIDDTTAEISSPFPKIKGTVYCMIPDGTGGWFVGGNFTEIDSISKSNLAHILSDGSLDTNWNASANGTVRALVLSDGVLYVGGLFTTINADSRSRVAALSAADGSTLVTWSGDANGDVLCLAVDGTAVYAGGSFTTIGGATRNRIAALNKSTGAAIMTWNPNSNNTVYTMLLSETTLYVGGSFTSIGGQSRNRIAALSTSSNTAASWNPNAGGNVLAMALSGSTLYIGGEFTTINGTTRNRIAALNNSLNAPLAWNPNSGGKVNSVLVSGSSVFAGGQFTTIGGESRNYIAALDPSTGAAQSWEPLSQGEVFALASSGNSIGVGGTFVSIGGKKRTNLGAFDAYTGEATDWDPNATGGDVRALAVKDSMLYVAGLFTNIGGAARNRLAAFDLSSGAVTPWDPNVSSTIQCMAVADSVAYIGGNFQQVGGQTRNFAAAVDLATGSPTTWNPNANNAVQCLAAAPDRVFVAGGFTSMGGQPKNGFVELNTTTGAATTWNPAPNASVGALAVSGSNLFVGGAFTSFNGAARSRFASINLDTYATNDWDPAPSALVTTFSLLGTKLYTGGNFSSIAGEARSKAAALDIAEETLETWNPSFNNVVYSVSTSDARIVTGGLFTQSRYYLASFDMNYDLHFITDGTVGAELQGDLSQTVPRGQDATGVTAVPPSGADFVKWTSNGEDLSTDNPLLLTNVTEDMELCAHFGVQQFALSYSAGENGSLEGELSQSVPYGGSGTAVTAIPDTGYEFVQWSDGNVTNPRTDTGVTADISVTAEFAIKSYNLSYSAGGNGALEGEVSQTVNHNGTGQPVTAVPAEGYQFVKWSDNRTDNPRIDANVTNNINVQANFAILTYSLDYHAGPGGSISGAASQTVNHGANGSSVTAMANVGFHFVTWSDDSTENPRIDELVTKSIDVTAQFAINTYQLTYIAGDHGSLSGLTEQTVNHGGNGSEVTAIPDSGYIFVQWSDGSTANPRVDTNVTEEATLMATFASQVFQLSYLAGPNGVISGSATQTVAEGGDGTPVQAIPDEGYHFVQWSDGSGANPRTDINVVQDISVTAQFAINQYTVSFVTNGVDGSSLTGNCSQIISHGDSCTEVSATAPPEGRFVKWMLNGEFFSYANPLVVSEVTSNMILTAIFSTDSAVEPVWHNYE